MYIYIGGVTNRENLAMVPEKTAKTARFELRLHPVIRRFIEMGASQARMTVTDFLVRAALEYCERHYDLTDDDAAADLAREGETYETWLR